MKNKYIKIMLVLIVAFASKVSTAQVSETATSTTNWDYYNDKSECEGDNEIGGHCIDIDWYNNPLLDIISHQTFLQQQQLATWFYIQKKEIIDVYESSLTGNSSVAGDSVEEKFEIVKTQLIDNASTSYYNLNQTGLHNAYDNITDMSYNSAEVLRKSVREDLASALIDAGGTDLSTEFSKYSGLDMPPNLGEVVHNYFAAENRVNQQIYVITNDTDINNTLKSVINAKHWSLYDNYSVFNQIKLLAIYMNYRNNFDKTGIPRLYPTATEINSYVDHLEGDRLSNTNSFNSSTNRKANIFNEDYINDLLADIENRYPIVFIRNQIMNHFIATIRAERLAAISNLSEADHANVIAGLIETLGINNENEITWLLSDYSRVVAMNSQLENASNSTYNTIKSLTLDRIADGGLVVAMVENLGITDEDQIAWLYSNESEANSLKEIFNDLNNFDSLINNNSFNPHTQTWLPNLRTIAAEIENIISTNSTIIKEKLNQFLDEKLAEGLIKTSHYLYSDIYQYNNTDENIREFRFENDHMKGVAMLLWEFAKGVGKDVREFPFDYDITQKFLEGNVLIDIKNDFLDALVKKNLTFEQFIISNEELNGKYAFSPDHTSLEDSFEKHKNANWVQFFIGGASAKYTPSSEDGWIIVELRNPTSRNSLLLHQGENYTRDGSGNNKSLSTIWQIFKFQLKIQ